MHAIVLLLVIDPSPEVVTSALTAASIDGLAERAELVVEHVKATPADEQALGRAKALHADVVIEVSWPGGDASRARLHAHLRPSAPWVDREFAFATTAPAWERGRSVGLAIAAMVPDDDPGAASTTPSAPTPAAPPTTSPARAAQPERRATTDAPPIDDLPSRAPAPSGAPSRAARLELGLLGEVAPPSGATSAGGGARLDGTWWLGDLGARATVGARFETFAGDARVADLGAGVGLAYRVLGRADGRALIVRADLSASYVTVGRERGGGESERHARFLPVVAAFAEGALPLTRQLWARVALGAELGLGETRIAVDEREVGALPRVRLLGQLGLGWTF